MDSVTFGSIKIPQPVLEAQRKGNLVVFAGAGVSMGAPANLPSFPDLIAKIERQTARRKEEELTFEEYLGRLDDEHVDVHQITKEIISDDASEPNRLHSELLRLFRSPGDIRIVTTNFDTHFARAAEDLEAVNDESFPVHEAPALPRGDSFRGLVHLHGSTEQDAGNLVLTDSDFSQAYITEGWATDFLTRLFRRYVVLFVGYSHEDDLMRFLARGISARNDVGRYAIDKGWGADKPQREAFWEQYGVHATFYPKGDNGAHEELPRSIEKWADASEKREERIVDSAREALSVSPQDVDATTIATLYHLLLQTGTAGWLVEVLNEELREGKTEHAGAWLRWAIESGLLDSLFSRESLTDPTSHHLDWVAEIVKLRPQQSLSVLSDSPSLHTDLVDRLLNVIATVWTGGDYASGKWTEKQVAKWLRYLLPQKNDLSDPVDVLLNKPSKEEDREPAKILFEHATRLAVLPEQDARSGSGHASQTAVLTFQEKGASSVGKIREMWDGYFNSHLGGLAEALEPILIDRLRSVQEAGSPPGDNAPLGTLKPSLRQSRDYVGPIREPLQDYIQDETLSATLIRAAIEVLQELAESGGSNADECLSRWGLSEVPIVRRIAIHVMRQSDQATADDIMEFVLRMDRPSLRARRPRYPFIDPTIWNDIRPALEEAYPECRSGLRRRLNNCLKRYLITQESGNGERAQLDLEAAQVSEQIFQLYRRLSENGNLDAIARESLSGVADGEDWLRELEEAGAAQQDNASQRNLEDLAPYRNWEDVLAVHRAQIDQRDGGDMPNTSVEKHIRQNPKWGIELARRLDEKGTQEDEIWTGILRALRQVELTEQQFDKLWEILSSSQTPEGKASVLHEHHVREITKVIHSRAQNEEAEFPVSYVGSLVETLDSLWEEAVNVPVVNQASPEWMQEHPCHHLMDAYIRGLAVDEEKSSYIGKLHERTGNVKNLIGHVRQVAGYALGTHGKSLFELDQKYDLSPGFVAQFRSLLDWKNRLVAKATWTGLLEEPGLTPEMISAFREELSVAFDNYSDLPSKERSSLSGVVRQAAWTVGFEPLQRGWLESFLEQLTPEDRKRWVQEGRKWLSSPENSEEKHQMWRQWIRAFFYRRVQHEAPVGLAEGEEKALLEWIPHLDKFFPDAVDIMTDSERSERLTISTEVDLLYDLKRKDLADHYPESVAQLLQNVLIRTESAPAIFLDDAEDIVDSLRSDIDSNIVEDIEEDIDQLR